MRKMKSICLKSLCKKLYKYPIITHCDQSLIFFHFINQKLIFALVHNSTSVWNIKERNNAQAAGFEPELEEYMKFIVWSSNDWAISSCYCKSRFFNIRKKRKKTSILFKIMSKGKKSEKAYEKWFFKRIIFLKSVSDGNLGRPCSDFFKICSSHSKVHKIIFPAAYICLNGTKALLNTKNTIEKGSI